MKNNLKLLRKQAGYTQIAVQMKTGIEQALLSKFENGERVPPTETLIRLAEFYNVSIDYILCRTDVPEVNKK
ncbi:MAG: helix-turn-helix transcriptional regulator [Clostridia bacterium]|nr:helix-turn-helix transcriptional regulator [Clostridia bacterium]